MANPAASANFGGRTSVRVVVVGDQGTGKSSLIITTVADSFPDNVPPVLPPTRLPFDFYPDRVPVTIIDTSSSPENRGKLAAECKLADAVVLTYACDQSDTLDRLSTFWLPELRRLEVRVPVIVVGCKLDLRDDNQQVSLEQVMSPIMQQFREIETCIECSALKQIQVPEVFYYAQKAVLHPTAPLFDQEAQTLKPRCVRALKRIFILCDHDRDGALSDAELNEFQVKCFNAPLQPSEVVGVKKVVQDKLPEGVNDRGLTLTGFLFLHALFIEKGRLETTWTVLRKFGYDNDLKLRDDLIPFSSKRGPDQSVELTTEAVEFLTGIFYMFDSDAVRITFSYILFMIKGQPRCTKLLHMRGSGKGRTTRVNSTQPYLAFCRRLFPRLEPVISRSHDDDSTVVLRLPFSYILLMIQDDGALRPAELDDLFSTAPASPWAEGPYVDAAEKYALGGLLLQGFLSEWALMTLLDPVSSLANLIYIGYTGDPASLFHITRRRRLDRKRQQSQRNVFQCYVFGPKRAGKSTLLNSFIGRPFLERYTETTNERFAANIVDNQMDTSKKTLIMREVPEDKVTRLLSNKESLAACDIAVFVYDSSDENSWKKTLELLVDVATHAENTGFEVPCLILAAKDDMDPSPTALQDSIRVSQDMGIEAPITVSMKLGDFNNVFHRIVSAAQHPHLSIPETEAGRSRKQYRQLVNRSLMFVSVGAAVAIVGLAAYRVYATRKNASS